MKTILTYVLVLWVILLGYKLTPADYHDWGFVAIWILIALVIFVAHWLWLQFFMTHHMLVWAQESLEVGKLYGVQNSNFNNSCSNHVWEMMRVKPVESGHDHCFLASPRNYLIHTYSPAVLEKLGAEGECVVRVEGDTLVLVED